MFLPGKVRVRRLASTTPVILACGLSTVLICPYSQHIASCHGKVNEQVVSQILDNLRELKKHTRLLRRS